jgi:nucleoside-diphosphate-sugar epimerase
MTTILVTGGTGVLGRPLTERLRADGHEVRVLSRHAQLRQTVLSPSSVIASGVSTSVAPMMPSAVN